MECDSGNECNESPPTSAPVGAHAVKVKFVFSKPGKMECPVVGCKSGKFATKGKYIRHWSERHMLSTTKYYCCLERCRISCRRRYDMKMHIRNVHHVQDASTIEAIVKDCAESVENNKGFIDPGEYEFVKQASKCRQQSINSENSKPPPLPLISGCQPPLYTHKPLTAPSAIPIPSSSIISRAFEESSEDNTHFSITIPQTPPQFPSKPPTKKLTVAEYKAKKPTATLTSTSASTSESSSVGQTSSLNLPSSRSVNSFSQTSSLELTPLVLPPLPESREELEGYIRWCCLTMDQVGRQRAAAKEKLDDIGPRFQEERNKRRQLEAEVRRLQREIGELKWRDRYVVSEPSYQ